MGLIVTSAPKSRKVYTLSTVVIGKTYCRAEDTSKLYMAIRRMDNNPLGGWQTSNGAQLVSLSHGNTVTNSSIQFHEVNIQAEATLL